MKRTYVADLDEQLVAEAARHTYSVWSGGGELEAHVERQRAQLLRGGRSILRYTGLVDDTGLVASIKRYGLSVHVPEFGRAAAVGIGAVFTRPSARGTGAASELLRAVLDEARADGCALGLLYSDIDPAFYERLGFVALPSLEHHAPTADLPGGMTFEVRPATPDDEPAMVAAYDASWDPSFVRPSRTLEILRFFRFRNHADAAWILRREGRDVGYVLGALHDGRRDDGATPPPRTFWVDEWAAPRVDLPEIYAALRHIAETEGATSVAGWLPLHLATPPFLPRPRPTAITMVCPLSKLVTRIDPERTFFGSLDHF